MSKKFVHAGYVTSDTARGTVGTLLLVDIHRAGELRFPFQQREHFVSHKEMFKQITDKTRAPFAIAVHTAKPDEADPTFGCFPVFAEVEDTPDGPVVTSLRIHMHRSEEEREKCPRVRHG